MTFRDIVVQMNKMHYSRRHCLFYRDLSKGYWIGLYKFVQTEWYDGNPSTYRNWIGGEPNDTDRCVAYTTNGFDDKACNEQHYYTCKKRIGNVSALVTNIHSLELAEFIDYFNQFDFVRSIVVGLLVFVFVFCIVYFVFV